MALDFEYLKFKVKDWFGSNAGSEALLPLPGKQIGSNASSTAATNNSTTPEQVPPTIIGSPGKPIPPPKISPFMLSIDSLNIRVPIVYVYAATEKEFQAGLIDGVVHYPGTALPGQAGNCYIFGHSSDYIWSKGKYKTIFAPLPKTTIGTEIVISDNQGVKFVYTVIDSKKVSAKDLSVLKQDYTKKILTLQTSYPVGTALARWVVVAEMK